MEREELAALRATRLAAERQPPWIKAREARLSAELDAPDGLPPYVLAESCSDPRDRVVPDELNEYRVLDHFAPLPPAARGARPPRLPTPRYESPPIRAVWVVVALLLTALLWFAFRAVTQVLLF